MKKLDKEVVCLVAEELMATSGTTTTLHVKKELRNRGYEAYQSLVSNFMQDVAREEGWKFTFNGKYKIYSLGPDTKHNIDLYLEMHQVFWKVSLENKTILIEEGRIGHEGVITNETHPSNKKAYKACQQMIAIKKVEGFEEAEDKRLSLKLRKNYAQYFKLPVQNMTLSFYNVKEIKTREGVLKLNNKEELTKEQLLNNVGAQFSFDLPTIDDVGLYFWQEEAEFTIIPKIPTKVDIFGCKLLEKSVFDYSKGVFLAENHELFTSTHTDFTTEWQVDMNTLYEVVFTFQNNQKIILNKFSLELQTEIIPVIQEFFKN